MVCTDGLDPHPLPSPIKLCILKLVPKGMSLEVFFSTLYYCCLFRENLHTSVKAQWPIITVTLRQGYVFIGVCDSVHGGGGVSQHALGHTPPPDGHCSGRYASYWNGFLLTLICGDLNMNIAFLRLDNVTLVFVSKLRPQIQLKCWICT